jgi:hypothetical protein
MGQTQETNQSNADNPHCPVADLKELLKHIENDFPQRDSLRFDSCADRLYWDDISFKVHSAKQCKKIWGMIQKELRRFKLTFERFFLHCSAECL